MIGPSIGTGGANDMDYFSGGETGGVGTSTGGVGTSTDLVANSVQVHIRPESYVPMAHMMAAG